jgi:O-antigen ligase
MNRLGNFLFQTTYTSGISILLIALGVSILLFGGWWYPAFSLIPLTLTGISLILLSLSTLPNIKKDDDLGDGFYATSPWCVGSIVAMSLYVAWRITQTQDTYAASDNLWLLLAGLGAYTIAMLYFKKDSTYWAFVASLSLIALIQLCLLIWQYRYPHPIHPLHGYVHWFLLPDGTSGTNQGYVSGTFFARGGLSAFLVIALFFSLSTALWAKCHIAIKMLLLWLSLFCLVGIALSMSRAAYLATAIGLLCFFALSTMLISRYSIVKKWLSLGILLIIWTPILLVTYTILSKNFALSQRLIELNSDPYREALWFDSIASVLNKDPLFGLGANSFDVLSTKLSISQLGRSVHAHNDWLQLFIEYGIIGLGLASLAYLTHLLSGIKQSYKIASRVSYESIIPQSTELSAKIACLISIIAIGIHSLFDYQLHLISIAILFAVCLGIIGGNTHWRQGEKFYYSLNSFKSKQVLSKLTWTLLSLALGAYLLVMGLKNSKPELLALKAENKLVKEEPQKAYKLARMGLTLAPQNPRLLILAAEACGQMGNQVDKEEERANWYTTSATYWLKAAKLRPNFAYALRETALTLDWSNQREKALEMHLRAIALNPHSALGYEYLGIHYYLKGEMEKAESLLTKGQKLPGSRLAKEYLERIKLSNQKNN